MTDANTTAGAKKPASRAYTQGMHLKKKPKFLFNADGSIKEVAEPLITPDAN